jgi:hypothetical protein
MPFYGTIIDHHGEATKINTRISKEYPDSTSLIQLFQLTVTVTVNNYSLVYWYGGEWREKFVVKTTQGYVPAPPRQHYIHFEL